VGSPQHGFLLNLRLGIKNKKGKIFSYYFKIAFYEILTRFGV